MKALQKSIGSKPLKESPKLTAQDLILKNYIALSEQKRAIEKELKDLKESFKHQGTHSTTNYVCSVTKQKVEEYTVKAHERTIIKVSKKGE